MGVLVVALLGVAGARATVFVTASDEGRGMGYSQGRELGILRAYNTMRGQEGFWSENRVTLLSGAELSQFSPDGDLRGGSSCHRPN